MGSSTNPREMTCSRFKKVTLALAGSLSRRSGEGRGEGTSTFTTAVTRLTLRGGPFHSQGVVLARGKAPRHCVCGALQDAGSAARAITFSGPAGGQLPPLQFPSQAMGSSHDF
jgi:hypothetical protein